MTTRKYHYLFGPVPSRRLGCSLGVDIIPLKTCTQNCIYCQLGKDAPQTLRRKDYVPIESILGELEQKITAGLEADYITLSGSGEPTLHSQLGDLIDGIRKLTDIPIAVITNSTLLSDPAVRRDCCKAAVVLPSLDAGDAETFKKMNHPHPDLDFEQFTKGLIRFRDEYTGQLWLEVFFCEGVNTDKAAIDNIAEQIRRINPDKVQINTSVRPIVHAQAARVSEQRLCEIAAQLGKSVEVITDFSKHTATTGKQPDLQVILETLQRRPCTLNDLCAGLGLSKEQLQPALVKLDALSKITGEAIDQKIYYKAV
ncbi:MAG: radical SAM protein [Planctomycetota bacterium]|nr:MAG: radical SAM protein [Planctomycetota bacterium]RKY13680.1 MAG: radical SAM protein [Planctomycetota bacterium]